MPWMKRSIYFSMMKPQYLFYLLAFLSACSSEQKPLTFTEMNAGQLFDRYKKDVVLIKNRSYFKITFSDRTTVFANNLNSDAGGSILLNEAEARDNAEENYGTGFFIGKSGIIATNFHVIAPLNSLLERTSIREAVVDAVQTTRDAAIEDLNWQVNSLLSHYYDTAYLRRAVPEKLMNLLDVGRRDESESYDSAFVYQNRIDSLVKVFTTLDEASNKDFTVTIETAELSIALDASSGNTNQYACHLYSVTDDNHSDLALIQTNDKSLPEGVEQGLDLFRNDTSAYKQTLLPRDTLKVTTPLYLISYNYGEEIARTADGMKVQLTQGSVSQENDKYRVLYSIPALPGSSGGPVFNKKGQLVAINYSGFGQNGNFNYGILAFQLKRLVDKPPTLQVPL